MKRLLSLALAVLLMIVAIPFAIAEEEMPHVTVWVSLDNTMCEPDCPVVQAIREASGIYIDPLFVPLGESSSKLSARIASGDLPDVFSIDNVTVKDLIAHNMILDLSDYLVDCPNILADGKERLTFGINAQGAVYGLPGNMGQPWAMCVRRDWMRNLGYDVGDESVIEMTISEFKELMYQFGNEDPDQNGVDDTFGFCAEDASFGMFAPIFAAHGIPTADNWGSMYYDENEGVCKSILKHPEFPAVLKDMQWFYQNNCMDSEFAVVADASTEFQYLWNGTAGATSWAPAGPTNNWLSRYTDEDFVDENSFVYVNITDDDGGSGGAVIKYGTNWTVVSASCEQPEAAMKFLDFCYSREGDYLTYFGIEGVHYRWIDKDAETYEYIGKYAEDISNQRTEGGWVIWSGYHADDNIQMRALTKITSDVVNYFKEHPISNAIIMFEAPAVASEVGSTLTDVIIGVFAQATTAESADGIDAMVAAAIEEYDKIGGITYDEQYTELYKEMMGL